MFPYPSTPILFYLYCLWSSSELNHIFLFFPPVENTLPLNHPVDECESRSETGSSEVLVIFHTTDKMVAQSYLTISKRWEIGDGRWSTQRSRSVVWSMSCPTLTDKDKLQGCTYIFILSPSLRCKPLSPMHTPVSSHTVSNA